LGSYRHCIHRKLARQHEARIAHGCIVMQVWLPLLISMLQLHCQLLLLLLLIQSEAPPSLMA